MAIHINGTALMEVVSFQKSFVDSQITSNENVKKVNSDQFNILAGSISGNVFVQKGMRATIADVHDEQSLDSYFSRV